MFGVNWVPVNVFNHEKKTDMNIKRIALVIGLLVLGWASVPAARASGFRVASHDAFASARGEAFVATADNPSAIYYNPAGIAQLKGHQVRGGAYGLYLHPTFGRYESEKDLQAVPQLFYTYSPDDFPLSFGLGVYSPYGLSTRWPHESGFRTVATEASLRYFTINPVVAWQVCPSLSLAAGVTANYAEMDLRQGLFWPTQPWDGFKFKGDGWDVGYNLGLLWKLHEKVAIGAAFRSTTTVKLEGNTESFNDVPIPGLGLPAWRERIPARANFPFPWNAVFGISYRPTPQWNFEFNADYTGWDRLGTVSVRQHHAPLVLPQEIAVPLQWKASWYYEFGVTRYLNDRWLVSAGYIFNENSVPDAHYLPVVADLDRHFFCVGTGFHGDRLAVDLTYQFGYGPSHTVRGSALSPIGQSADGKYKFLSHAVLLTLGWQF
ncbi:MAG: putative outer membrane protein precursor [Verrucomicrobia bacterium ADurb.Bin118]|jgi:long-chain fatty acid transport protein|nr:MAG: putative outer membrane protein precursor [Verrucomicrobia bacterium ADurb.Bin118]